MIWLLATLSPVHAAQLSECADMQDLLAAGLSDPFAHYVQWAQVRDVDGNLSGREAEFLGYFRACQEFLFRQQVGATTPDQAAALHVLYGLLGYAMTPPDLKERAGPSHAHFCAARAIRPALQFPDELGLAEDLRLWWDAPCPEPGADRLPAGSCAVDGDREARSTPKDSVVRPYLFQEVDGSGEVVRSSMVEPGMSRPNWEREPLGRSDRGAGDVNGGGIGLAVAGAGAATAGTVLLYQAAVVGPARHSAELTDAGWETYRSEQLVPMRAGGYVLAGIGVASLAASALSFTF